MATKHIAPLPALGLVFAALIAVLPGIPGWFIIARYAAIPRFAVTHERDITFSPAGIPPLVGGETVALRRDGALFAADWKNEHVLALDARGGGGRWLFPRGRFELQVGPDEGLHLLDRTTGFFHRFSPDGRLQASSRVVSPGSTCSLAVDSRGGLFVAEKERNLVRKLDASLGPDVSFGRGGAIGLPSVVGLAASTERLYAVSDEGALFVLASDGRLLRRELLVGNAGRLAIGPQRRLFMADKRADRIWVFDPEGRTLGRLSADDGGSLPEPASLAFTPQGALYVSTQSHVAVFRLAALEP